MIKLLKWLVSKRDYETFKARVVDMDGEVNVLTIRDYKNGQLSVRRYGKWYDANADGSFPDHSYMERWTRL